MSELVIFSSLNRHQRSSLLLSWKREICSYSLLLLDCSIILLAVICWNN